MKPLKISWAAARVNAGKTQRDVASYMKVSMNTVVAWEKGEQEPRINDAIKLSEYYGMPLENIKT